MGDGLVGEALLDAIAHASGLSPLFAKNSIVRALSRAGVAPGSITQDRVRGALAEIRRGLLPFLPPEQADAAIARIQRLCS
jgi:hypothetical protein